MRPNSNVEQRSSSLLTKDENEQIFNLLGQKCQALSTTVVQLYCTEGPDGTHWMKKDIGVLCLVRDINRRSYFFRLFCPLRNRMVWEHEIYNSMQYLAPKSFLHTFEAEERIVAFNFASEDEAIHMRGILLEKLKTKEQKRLERRKVHGRNSVAQAPSRPAPMPSTVSNGYVYPKAAMPSKSFTRSNKKNKKKSITKADIGNPQNFRHVSHVGWDPTTGFDLENVDKSMRKFFEKVGISESDLKDKETREFIYDFIEKHGGLDAVKQDIHHQSILPPPSPPPPPPVPSRNAPAPAPSSNFRPAPPPPPSRNASAAHPAPPPPPSDPPPVNVMMQRNHEQMIKRTAPNATGPMNNAPPPPPPPPLPPPNPISEGNGPPIPPVSSSSNSAPSAAAFDPRSALMESIRSGTKLKHVEADSKKTDDSRGELLNQIRQGVELKSVQPVEKPSQGSLPVDGLAGALARALAERSKAIHSDSSDTNDSDESDSDEWG